MSMNREQRLKLAIIGRRKDAEKEKQGEGREGEKGRGQEQGCDNCRSAAPPGRSDVGRSHESHWLAAAQRARFSERAGRQEASARMVSAPTRSNPRKTR